MSLSLYLVFFTVTQGSLTTAANYAVRTETRTYNSVGQPAKVEVLITIQDSSVPVSSYIELPAVQENVQLFQRLPDNLTTEEIVKAALKSFRREFMLSWNGANRRSPQKTSTIVEVTQSSQPETRQTRHLAPTATQIGPIGESSNIIAHCLFFTNCSYSCKTNCDGESSPLKRTFPTNKNLRYTEYNCTKNFPVDAAARWKETDGIVRKFFDSSRKDEIVATCAFYAPQWYECFGVADCARGDQGFLTCAGAAPWRGFYQGSPLQGPGWKGNVTQEAMNSPDAFQSQNKRESEILQTCN
ncbi:hypothetical protein BV898_18506 [Hypsibius exemplaris]|uniref:SEA domain-containing protein n=1 Tax=Hypsibius exemplaris TaxID=2072580 RepID=A0A9X6NHD9_HYPEX|nr:hypothetical protein BV898_18506 [Hypsibius exemplaris]